MVTKNRFNRITKEITKTKVEKVVDETMKINPEELINPLENVRTVFFFRTHITGYIESGNVSSDYKCSINIYIYIYIS